MSSRAYVAAAPDGSPLELHCGADDEGWHLFSTLPEHAGIDYLGDDLHTAMHLTMNIMRETYRMDGWTVDGRDQGGPIWGSVTAPNAAGGRSWWARLLRSSEEQE